MTCFRFRFRFYTLISKLQIFPKNNQSLYIIIHHTSKNFYLCFLEYFIMIFLIDHRLSSTQESDIEYNISTNENTCYDFLFFYRLP